MKYMKRSEDTEQMSVVSWARWNVQQYPELKWLYHVPNGGSRNRAEAAKFKQMGGKGWGSGSVSAIPKRRVLRSVDRNEVRTEHAAGDAEGISCRHGSRRTFCCNLLFRA